jgi:hypothetical protein
MPRSNKRKKQSACCTRWHWEEAEDIEVSGGKAEGTKMKIRRQSKQLLFQITISSLNANTALPDVTTSSSYCFGDDGTVM